MQLVIRFLSGALVALVLAVQAQAATLLRDADIEHSLRELARPVLRAAGLSADRVRILVIHDRSLNAFVTDHDHIFIHSGLLLRLDTPEMLQAAIAHEAAHIANGHLARRAANARSARTAAGLGMALAAAAAASGAKGAGGIALGTASSAQRLFLAHTRAEEAAADQSGIRYLARAGVDPKGAVALHELFRGQEALSVHRQDPYVQSHPLSADRVRAMKAYVAANPATGPRDNAAIYWHARARAKLQAFLRAPKWVLRNADRLPTPDLRLMAQAVAHHRRADLTAALRAIDGAIALRPRDAFLHDLKGEILLKSRQPAAAVIAYGTARKLAPRDAQIIGGLGRAQLAAGRTKPALATLREARGRDFRNPLVLRDLAQAYAKTGQRGMASLVTAERYALQGRLKDAAIHARRAEGLLPQGSGGWQRADDILHAARRAE